MAPQAIGQTAACICLLTLAWHCRKDLSFAFYKNNARIKTLMLLTLLDSSDCSTSLAALACCPSTHIASSVSFAHRNSQSKLVRTARSLRRLGGLSLSLLRIGKALGASTLAVAVPQQRLAWPPNSATLHLAGKLRPWQHALR